mmetsp:Transcript_70943/g.198995  ORF Transcript_70943/g.198995 Transcript_70943/m.198995 type:complete len:267 (+) Transcript_70943:113-913(+)
MARTMESEQKRLSFSCTRDLDSGSKGAKLSSKSSKRGQASRKNTCAMSSAFTFWPPDNSPYQSSFSRWRSSATDASSPASPPRAKSSSAISCRICPSLLRSTSSATRAASATRSSHDMGLMCIGQYNCCGISATSSLGNTINPSADTFTPAGKAGRDRPQLARIPKSVLLPQPLPPVTAYTRPGWRASSSISTLTALPREYFSLKSCTACESPTGASQRAPGRDDAASRPERSSRTRFFCVSMLASLACSRLRVINMSMESSMTRV